MADAASRLDEPIRQPAVVMKAEEKKKRLGSNFSKIRKSARMIGSANRVVKDLSGARRTWRKAIRLVITNNRQQANMVGVLKSRAMKGMSVGERLKRCEDRLYKELRDTEDLWDYATEIALVGGILINRDTGGDPFPNCDKPLVVAYHCGLYALQEAMKLRAQLPKEDMGFVIGLMDKLEAEKGTIGEMDNPAIIVENFAQDLFQRADDADRETKDRAARANRGIRAAALGPGQL